jgi:hypothetical protein
MHAKPAIAMLAALLLGVAPIAHAADEARVIVTDLGAVTLLARLPDATPVRS